MSSSTHPRPSASPANPAKRPRNRARGGKAAGGSAHPVSQVAAQDVSGASTPPLSSGAMTPAHGVDLAVDDILAPTATRHLSDKSFKDFPIRQDLLQGIPFDRCTEVQAKTLPAILAGEDVLAQAKTGTGKTLGFLVPTLQSLVSLPSLPPANQTSILILSPTRELALQIATAGEPFLRFLPHKYEIQTAIGGTSMDKDLKALRNRRADVLVATPGRLLDHIENHGLGERLRGVRWVVLDEADRLLEQGFRKEILKILAALPNRAQQPRQTLLFSATIPAEVHTIANLALLPNHTFISTLTEEDRNTHAHVEQRYAVVDLADSLPAALKMIEKEKRANPTGWKIMAFFPTARATGLAYEVFNALDLGPTFEIHSRKSQSQRTKAADEFKLARCGVLFSSDVTARGIDVPGVTSVLQVGLPASAEQYTHRLGRTARAGASGHGSLILTAAESFFLRKRDVAGLGLKEMEHAKTEMAGVGLVTERQRINSVLDTIPNEAKAQAYQAWLGFYNSELRELRWTQDQLVSNANEYALVALRYRGPEGEGSTPPLLAKTVGKMGLKGVRGLNIVRELPGASSSGGGGGGRGGGRGGGGGGGGGRGGARGGRGGGGGGRGGGSGGGGFATGPVSVPGSGGRPMATTGPQARIGGPMPPSFGGGGGGRGGGAGGGGGRGRGGPRGGRGGPRGGGGGGHDAVGAIHFD